jgi:2TM family of unknown function (DUF5676)
VEEIDWKGGERDDEVCNSPDGPLPGRAWDGPGHDRKLSTPIHPERRCREMRKLNLEKVGLTLGIFFAVIYALCVAFDLLFPQMAMYAVWQKLLPGFTWLSLGSFLVGLVESFFYGVLFAIIFVPLYNYLGEVFAEKATI